MRNRRTSSPKGEGSCVVIPGPALREPCARKAHGLVCILAPGQANNVPTNCRQKVGEREALGLAFGLQKRRLGHTQATSVDSGSCRE